eukprot:scaffold66729_cov33-Tisochrysis_lutea.AAC.6
MSLSFHLLPLVAPKASYIVPRQKHLRVGGDHFSVASSGGAEASPPLSVLGQDLQHHSLIVWLSVPFFRVPLNSIGVFRAQQLQMRRRSLGMVRSSLIARIATLIPKAPTTNMVRARRSAVTFSICSPKRSSITWGKVERVGIKWLHHATRRVQLPSQGPFT